MAKKDSNKNLHKAKTNKKDEFYTQLTDIENELKHYKKHFKNKVIYCNCDDPRVSNFFHYFSYNFEKLGLKTITHKDLSKITNATVLLRAHGEPPSTYRMAMKNNIKLVDASCLVDPLFDDPYPEVGGQPNLGDTISLTTPKMASVKHKLGHELTISFGNINHFRC